MSAIVFRVKAAQLSAIKAAAADAGQSQADFCRRAAMRACNGKDLEQLIREIHAAIVGFPGSEATMAAEALVQMGWDERRANKAAAAFASQHPQADAAGIITGLLAEG